MAAQKGAGPQLGGVRTDPVDSQVATQSSVTDRKPPAPAVPNITVINRYVRTYNGILLTLDKDMSHATVDVGRVRSWDAVSALPKLANAVAECVQIDLVGEDAQTLAYIATELPKALRHAEPWLAGDFDDRRAG
jgi:hypothetical protein